MAISKNGKIKPSAGVFILTAGLRGWIERQLLGASFFDVLKARSDPVSERPD